jgi:uncharacterized protein (DUF2267 family)
MSRLGLEVFETTLQKTYDWLNELMQILKWDDRQQTYLALRGTLQALRDRLPPEIAVKLGAQLPMLIRGFYYEGWKPAETPIKIKHTQEFLDFVQTHFSRSALNEKQEDIESIVKAVFQVISHHISEGEVYHLKQVLPLPIAILWPESTHSSVKNR